MVTQFDYKYAFQFTCYIVHILLEPTHISTIYYLLGCIPFNIIFYIHCTMKYMKLYKKKMENETFLEFMYTKYYICSLFVVAFV